MELYGAEGSGIPVELPDLATEFSPTPGSVTLPVIRRRKKGVRPLPQLPNKYIMLLMGSMMYPLNELSLPLLGACNHVATAAELRQTLLAKVAEFLFHALR